MLNRLSSLVGPLSPRSPQDVVTRGLVVRLETGRKGSYPESGTTWTDLTGGNDGTLSGPTWSSTDGGIFDFDGSNDIVTITHDSNISLSTSAQRTVQVWVKFDALPASPKRTILLAKLSGNFSFDGYWAGIDSAGKAVCATNGTSVSKTTTSASSISIDTWYLYTFISQITSTTNTTKVYINDTEYISTSHGSDGYSESNNFLLGYFPTPHTGLSTEAYLDGKVGACHIYNRGLSLDEIKQNFNAQRSKYGV